MSAFWLPQAAEAACTPAIPTSGSTVICSPNQDGDYAVSGLDALSVNILSGAAINGKFSATNIGVLDFLNSGHTNGLVTLSTSTSLLFRNSGTLNQGLSIFGTGTTSITNDAGGHINGTVQIAGDGAHSVTNAGTVNNNILLTGNGSSDITNEAGATLNGGIQSTGTSTDVVNNSGTIQGSLFDLGAGNDTVINRAGVVNSDIVLGDGDDAFDMLGGLVRRVDAGSGNDAASISGGTIDDFYRAQAGDDTLTWSGGSVRNIDMGVGTDIAVLENLPSSSLRDAVAVSGGLGSGDILTFVGTAADGPGRFDRWEWVELTEGSSLTMAPANNKPGDLTLGDEGTGTGELFIHASSTVNADGRNAAVVPFDGNQLVTVTNAGTINLTGRDSSGKDSFRIRGDYVGQDGTISLHTKLMGDGAASDKLVIDGGNASGSTGLDIVDAGGGGKETTGNGILVVETVNNGTTDSNAFSLAHTVAKGPYEYNLFYSSKDNSGPENWYLRTEDGITDPCEPEDGGNGNGGDGGDGGDGDGDGGGENGGGGGNGGGGNGGGGNGGGGDGGGNGGGNGDGNGGGGNEAGGTGPFRPEVALYATTPQLALRYGSMLLDTLHQRRGDDPAAGSRRRGNSDGQYVWGRALGKTGYQRCVANPEKKLDYDLFGVQAGIDLYRAEHASGASDTAGVYGVVGGGHGRTSFFGEPVGSNSLSAFTFGGYWTHYGSNGWYLDGLLQGTWYDIDADSNRPFALSTNGVGLGASLETGYPFRFDGGWIIEPQAQLAYQAISIDDGSDSAATVTFSDVNSLLGRIGARVAKTWDLAPGEPDPRLMTAWVRASYAYQFLESPTTAFSAELTALPFDSDFSGSSVILNAGLDADLRDNVAIYANVDYQIQFDGIGEAIGGEIGLKVRW